MRDGNVHRTLRCAYCGEPLRLSDTKHMKEAHPDILAAQGRLEAAERLAWGKVALPGFVLWFLLVVYIVFIAPNTIPHDYKLPVIVGSSFVVIFGGLAYALRVTRLERQGAAGFSLLCRICDERMSANRLRDHNRNVHPGEVRYAMRVRAYLLGSAVLITVLVSLFFTVLEPFIFSGNVVGAENWGRGLVFMGASLWFVGLFVWLRVVDTRHEARARKAWADTHPPP